MTSTPRQRFGYLLIGFSIIFLLSLTVDAWFMLASWYLIAGYACVGIGLNFISDDNLRGYRSRVYVVVVMLFWWALLVCLGILTMLAWAEGDEPEGDG